jgi:hypothetical protein
MPRSIYLFQEFSQFYQICGQLAAWTFRNPRRAIVLNRVHRFLFLPAYLRHRTGTMREGTDENTPAQTVKNAPKCGSDGGYDCLLSLFRFCRINAFDLVILYHTFQPNPHTLQTLLNVLWKTLLNLRFPFSVCSEPASIDCGSGGRRFKTAQSPQFLNLKPQNMTS